MKQKYWFTCLNCIKIRFGFRCYPGNKLENVVNLVLSARNGNVAVDKLLFHVILILVDHSKIANAKFHKTKTIFFQKNVKIWHIFLWQKKIFYNQTKSISRYYNKITISMQIYLKFFQFFLLRYSHFKTIIVTFSKYNF